MISKNWLLLSIALFSCCSVVGCGTVETSSDAGLGQIDAGSVVADAGMGDGSCLWHTCPASRMGLTLDVANATDGRAVNDVSATLAGDSSGTMSCEVTVTGEVTACEWPYSLPDTDATYALSVSAPGFLPANVTATVTSIPASRCGCPWAKLSPSSVTLAPVIGVTVDVSQLFNVNVPACSSGYEHPNICCLGAPYVATFCTEDVKHPFDICGSGQFTYPDPNTCCSIADEADCAKAPLADAADSGVQNNCTTPCAPGAYPDAADATLCRYGVEGVMSQTTPPACYGHCSSLPPDYCTTPCPASWSKSSSQNDLCCRLNPSGQTFCYSQTAEIRGFSGGQGHGDASSFFSEQFFDDGNSYVMTCDFTKSTCNCVLNGNVVMVMFATQFDDRLMSHCPFPMNP